MLDPLSAFVLLLLWGSGSRKASPAAAMPPDAPPPKPMPAPVKPRPRPVSPGVVLPPNVQDITFPGPRWEPDVPTADIVHTRAWELLPVLWAKGEGTGIVEDLGPSLGVAKRPTGFLATRHGTKKAVTAWKLKAGTVLPPVAQVAPVAPVVPPVSPAEVLPTPEPTAPAEPAPPSRVVLPTLRRGDRGPDVRLAQEKLGGLTADGIFGPLTEERVIAYQVQRSLQVDGVIGPETWGALFSEGGWA